MEIICAGDREEVRKYTGSVIAGEIADHPLSCFECRKDSYLMSLDILDLADLKAGRKKIVIYFSPDALVFICDGEDMRSQVSDMVKGYDSNESALHGFFSSLIKDDSEKLEAIEDRITVFEAKLLADTRKANMKDFIRFRKSIRDIKKYYDGLDKVTEGLSDNESDIISEGYIRHFQILAVRVDRLLAYAQNQRDYVTQVREAYQSQIDIEQNKLMKVFTVVSTIFLPLTLLVGWYGMNFKIPEFAWHYGYLFVALLSLAILGGCIIFFKKKKWF